MFDFDILRIKTMLLKEVRHILRDKFTVAIASALPLVLILVFGFIIELNYDNIKIFLRDENPSRISRFFASKLASSGYLTFSYFDGADVLEPIEKEKTAAVLILPQDFSKNIANNNPAKIQLLLDGSDGTKASLAVSYLSSILDRSDIELTPLAKDIAPLYEIRTRFLFNPQLNSKWFVVPGLIVIVIGLISILLTALTIAKEWERGSMELLLSTHIKPIEIVIGKIIPYIFFSLAGIIAVFAASKIVFSIPFKGSLALFAAVSCIYIISCLSLGILISVITRQQQLAMMVSLVIGLMPSMFLSGFIFPIENMPLFFRVLTFVLPQRHFMEVCRGLFLRGSTFYDLLTPILMICLFCIFTIAAASKKFKTDLEP